MWELWKLQAQSVPCCPSVEIRSLCGKTLTEDFRATLWWPLVFWDGPGGATSVPEETASECLLLVIERIAWGTVF